MDSGTDDAEPPGNVEVRRRFDWQRTPPSVAVVSALAEARGVDATAVEPLYDTVDPDALDAYLVSALDRDARTAATVTVTFGDLLVVVHGTGEIVVTRSPGTPRDG